MKISGIYQIQSIIKPERFYIGSAVRIDRRWRQHLHGLRHNKHVNKKLQSHFNKYGEADLQFSILAKCDIPNLIEKEQALIKSQDPWFNLSPNAGSQLGLKHSPETCEKFRHNTSERWKDPEYRERMSEIHKGQPGSRRGTKASDETRKKLSISHIGIQKGEKHYMFGKHHSPETREKLKQNHKGRTGKKNSAEHIAKLSRPHSEESKQKMRIKRNQRGPITEETRNRMRVAQQKRQIEHPVTEATKQKRRGRIPWNKGKKGIYSEETIALMKNNRRNIPAWNKGKKIKKIA